MHGHALLKINRGFMNTFQAFIHQLFVRSWWILAFMFASAIIYEHGLKERESLYQQLTEELFALQQQKKYALQQQQNLQLQINSQSDLTWIELTLMKELGLVPEGQQKIYFYPPSPENDLK